MFFPTFRTEKRSKKMRLRAFSSLFDRINAIFSRITSHRQESPWFCGMSGTFALSANWIACDLWSSLRVCLIWFAQCFGSTNVFFCIRLHSHALIRGLRVFELSHLLLHLRLIPLLLRDQLWNGSTPAPYWQCYKVRNSRFVIMNSADHPRREICVLRKTLPGWSILKNIGRPISF